MHDHSVLIIIIQGDGHSELFQEAPLREQHCTKITSAMDFHTNEFIVIPSVSLKSNSHSDFPSASTTFSLNSVSESITPH